MNQKKSVGLYAFAVLFQLFFQMGALAAPPQPVVSDKLISEASVQGKVRVIVNLKMPKLPDWVVSLGGKAYDDALEVEINLLQEAVLQRLYGVGITPGSVSKYRFTPQISMVLDENSISALRQDTDVEAIIKDGFQSGDLKSSVPIIFPSYQSSPYSGEGWNIAVLDTGVDTSHFAFGNKVIAEGCASNNLPFDRFGDNIYHSLCPDGADVSKQIGSGVDCTNRLAALSQQLDLPIQTNTKCGHGTYVAGIAVGNYGSYAQGVARDAGLIPIQVFTAISDNNSIGIGAFTSDVLRGLERVFELRHAHKIAAVNISIGGSGNYDSNTACKNASGFDGNAASALLPMIRMLRNRAKIATIFASGNNSHQDGVGRFACIAPAITVGAVDDNDQRYTFSNSGKLLDLWAPGVAIESAKAGGFTEVSQGTSAAAPHVAGAWAVMKQNKPDASVREVESAFKTTGKKITVNRVTRRRIDIDAALEKLSGSPVPKALSPSGIVRNNSPVFTWTAVRATTTYAVYAKDSTGKTVLWNSVSASRAGCASGRGECSVSWPTKKFANGPALWNVRTVIGAGYGEPSNTLHFTVKTGNNSGDRTVDFEEVSVGSHLSIWSRGFRIESKRRQNMFVRNDDTHGLQPRWGDTILLSRLNEGSFSLRRFDFKQQWRNTTGRVLIKGIQTNGHELTASYNFNNSNAAFSTRTLNWSGLTRVEFILRGALQIDNLVYKAQSGGTEIKRHQSIRVSQSLQNTESLYYTSASYPPSSLSVELSGGTGNADLYMRRNAIPTLTAYDCRARSNGNEDACQYDNASPGRWYIMIHAKKPYRNVSLSVQ